MNMMQYQTPYMPSPTDITQPSIGITQPSLEVPFGAKHVSDKSAGPKYTYLPGIYEIILDSEYADNFIVNSARSRSMMEKYTEAIARITFFFESQKGAQADVNYMADSPYPHIFINYPQKYRSPVGTETYPVAQYSADNFIKDLEQLKEQIKSLRK
jgi:hypothetical protein